MQKSFIAAATYLGLGLVAGVFYREFTRAMDYIEPTQLNTLHTHFLVLGTFFFLIVIALDKLFDLSSLKGFNGWFILQNVGLAWTTGAMLANGIVHVVSGPQAWTAMHSGIAGLGHIVLTVAIIGFFRLLSKAMNRSASAQRATQAAAPRG